MPHKHTRRGNSAAHADLPPDKIATALPAFEEKGNGKGKGKGKGKKQDDARRQKVKQKQTARANGYKEDDTPRAFARLMQFQETKKRPSGLDDGAERKKKRKLDAHNVPATAISTPVAAATVNTQVPKIMPGESLADYSARVDQALPVGGLARKGKVDGVKDRQTRKEKKMHRMYAEWREQDAKIKERLEEEQELQEEAEEEKRAQYGDESFAFPESRKARRKRLIGEAADRDEDPWKVLKEKRLAEGEERRGLNDVVQAPPAMTVVPKEKFKVQGGAKVQVANVPGGAGSLKRREELGEARRQIIEQYRAMMKGKGGL
ncbi:hypothetical protein Tdes44962_MAKER00535 [Teratosphaeria destructans]|uniref:Urease accessory protein UreD n=1 Tax=Teratosphaeria destructans TaxID=418781 RepID=A0A9W7SQ75_9PEZI|nr:hypothetical protein Tdes44962_MAKER00535 [Teratosphaeria destructans]